MKRSTPDSSNNDKNPYKDLLCNLIKTLVNEIGIEKTKTPDSVLTDLTLLSEFVDSPTKVNPLQNPSNDGFGISIFNKKIWTTIIQKMLINLKIPSIYLAYFGRVILYQSKQGFIEPRSIKRTTKRYLEGSWSLEELNQTKFNHTFIRIYESIYTINYILKPLMLMSKESWHFFNTHMNTIPIKIFYQCGFIPIVRRRKKKRTTKRNRTTQFENDNNVSDNDDSILTCDIDTINLLSKSPEREKNPIPKKTQQPSMMRVLGKIKKDNSGWGDGFQTYFNTAFEDQTFEQNILLLKYFISYQNEIVNDWVSYDSKDLLWSFDRTIHIPRLDYSSPTEMTHEKWDKISFSNLNMNLKQKPTEASIVPFIPVFMKLKEENITVRLSGYLPEFTTMRFIEERSSDSSKSRYHYFKLQFSDSKIFAQYITHYYKLITNNLHNIGVKIWSNSILEDNEKQHNNVKYFLNEGEEESQILHGTSSKKKKKKTKNKSTTNNENDNQQHPTTNQIQPTNEQGMFAYQPPPEVVLVNNILPVANVNQNYYNNQNYNYNGPMRRPTIQQQPPIQDEYLYESDYYYDEREYGDENYHTPQHTQQ